MPQLDLFYFWGESIVTLILLYTIIYFYLFWFSKQNFEQWIISTRWNYYFEKQLLFFFFFRFNEKFFFTLRHEYETYKSLYFFGSSLDETRWSNW